MTVATRAGSATSYYMREIKKYPQLTAEEEQDLARLIQDGQEAAEALASLPRPSPLERRSLTRRRDAGAAARERLINSNLRLVVFLAKPFARPGIDLLDVVSEGNIGLIKAVDTYKPVGVPFSAWARLWIRQAVDRGSHAVERAIRLPSSVIDDAHKAARALADLAQTLGREPSTAEIAQHTGIPEQRIAAALDLRHPTSIDTPLDDVDTGTVADRLADDGRDVADLVVGEIAVGELASVLGILTPDERAVLLARLGADRRAGPGIGSVAEAFDMSRERVRNLEMRALAKLRHPRFRFVRQVVTKTSGGGPGLQAGEESGPRKGWPGEAGTAQSAKRS